MAKRGQRVMEKLFLIDAYALIFRFYYAFLQRPMRNSDGQNISAVFGFVKFLGELIDRERPDHLGVAFDPRGGNFRHQLYPAYKANRAATPEDIINSVPIIKEILEAMRIPILEVAGYEADDVIGTLSTKAAATGSYQVFMVTPDKDYGQLIRPNVSMYKPAKTGVEIVGFDDLCGTYGIANPMQIIDILALWGDASDNIPGVAGIGEKGASRLIAQWGSIDNILANLDRLTPKQAQAISDGREQLLLSRTLATIALDVPIEFEPERLVIEKPDVAALRRIYHHHGFNMFLRELDSLDFHEAKAPLDLFSSLESAPAVRATPYSEQQPKVNTSTEENYLTVTDVAHTYYTVDTDTEIDNLVMMLEQSREFCFDTETTSVDAMNCSIVGLSFAIEHHTAYWVPLTGHDAGARLERFSAVFSDERITKVGQNLKYDMLVLRSYGIEVRGRLLDTMIIHYLLDAESRHGMDFLSRKYLNYNPIPIEDLIGKGTKQLTMDRVAGHLVAQYAAEDADVTLQLRNRLWTELEQEPGLVELYNTIEEPLVRTLVDIEWKGVMIDPEKLGESAEALNAQLAALEQQIRELADIPTLNINSPKQLGEVLYEQLKITDKPRLTKTKQYRTDEETLQAMTDSHPVIGMILEYRGVKKLLSTYIEALPGLINPRTERIHTSFNQAVTSTGRLSSTNPNLQNIPIRDAAGREIRKAFVAAPGAVLISADYSQVELRVMAHLSGDRNLQQAFLEGEDVHTSTAAKIYGVALSDVTREQRRRAKTANFGIIYGISVYGLSQRLQISRTEASELINGYFELYPGVKTYMEQIKLKAREQGYIETIFSRRRYLADINSSNGMTRSYAERNAINAPIQGSAADIMKIAMNRVHEALAQYEARIVLQVHDELVVETPLHEAEQIKELLINTMSSAAHLSVPLLVEAGIGDNWLDAH